MRRSEPKEGVCYDCGAPCGGDIVCQKCDAKHRDRIRKFRASFDLDDDPDAESSAAEDAEAQQRRTER